MRILEEISEYLCDIGSTGAISDQIQTLALDFTRHLTGDELLNFAREVLPKPYARQVEGRRRMGDDFKVGDAKWTKYAQDIYRRVCAELVFLDMGAQGVSNKVRSSKLAWLRKRLDGMEPEQVAHVIRPLLKQHRGDLDTITAAWLPHVSESIGPNDEYHDAHWASLSFEDEKLTLSAGFELLKFQLHEQHTDNTADLLLHGSFEALSGFNCQLQLIYRLLQPEQRHDILQFSKQGKPIPHEKENAADSSRKRRRQ